MDTIKIYHEDAYCREFDAEIQTVTPVAGGDGQWEVVLNRTAFYPESGGQPWDTGEIGGQPVVAVREAAGRVIHILTGHPGAGAVRGRIDWERRFDHMQQHSGEHILSGVFLEKLGANNVGFHLGALSSQIDLDVDNLTADDVLLIEMVANQAIYANHQVVCHQVEDGDLSQFALRKELTKTVSRVRVIAMAAVDCCPCGGTHVARTGEVGLIKIRSWEKKKGGVRVDFVCGLRALSDYQQKNHVVSRLAALLSAAPEQLTAAAERQEEKIARLSRELSAARRQLNRQLAAELLQQRDGLMPITVLTHVLAEPGSGELAELASLLTAEPSVVALLAGVQPDAQKTTLVFAASADLAARVNMRETLSEVAALIGGKGGGTPLLAQGGGGSPERVLGLLERAREYVLNAGN